MRWLVTLVTVLVVAGIGMAVLAGRAREKPRTQVEQAVSLANLR